MPRRRSRKAAAAVPTAAAAVQKKPIRASMLEAPKYGAHLLVVFAGLEPNNRKMIPWYYDHMQMPRPSTDNHQVFKDQIPPASLLLLTHNADQNGFCMVDAEAEVVELYRAYLSHGTLFIKSTIENDQEEWSFLADAYVLGYWLQDEKFCNAVIDGIIEKQVESDEYPTSIASPVCANTSADDGLRSLVIDMHVWAGHGDGIESDMEDSEAPLSFLVKVRRGVQDLAQQINDTTIPFPWVHNACQYHKHEITPPCHG